MRIIFPNNSRPKKAAKFIASVAGSSLSKCQDAVAKASGYSDWHELAANFLFEHATPLDEKISSSAYVERQIEVADVLVKSLDITSIDAQYFLTQSRLTGNRVPDLNETLQMCCKLLRRNEIQLPPIRSKGAVGKLKTPGRNGEQVILKQFGQPTHILSHQAGNTTIADFEFISPKICPGIFVPMGVYIPYGVWTEKSGSKVLFSQDYCPLWRLCEGKRPQRIEPWERIKYEKQEIYWEVSPPWENEAAYETMLRLLKRYKIPGLPLLANTFPIALHSDKLIDYATSSGHFHNFSGQTAMEILKRNSEEIK